MEKCPKLSVNPMNQRDSKINAKINILRPPGMWNEYAKPTFVFILIFFALYCVAFLYESHKEQQCSEKCLKAGTKGYEYKGCSMHGPGFRHLKPGVCKCLT